MQAQFTGKSWRIRWTDEYGKRRTEGGFPNKKLAELFGQRMELDVKEIAIGIRTGRPMPRKFKSICDFWIENNAKQKRSGVADELNIRRHLLPAFEHLYLHEISSAHVLHYISAKKELSIKTIHNHLTLLISLLNQAHANRWLKEVPKLKCNRPITRAKTAQWWPP